MTDREREVAIDQTSTPLSDYNLAKKSLCDAVVDVKMGCGHGCVWCYVPTMLPHRFQNYDAHEDLDVDDPQAEWGEHVGYRPDLPGLLRQALQADQPFATTGHGRGVVGVSFGTDPYEDPTTALTTRNVLEILGKHNIPARVLTRNPARAAQDLDVFEALADEELVTIGSSINTLDTNITAALEPNAPPPQERIRGLQQFADAGIPTFVSLSPTYPTDDRQDIYALMEELISLSPGVVFSEPINVRGKNLRLCQEAATAAGLDDLAEQLEIFQANDEHYRAYYVDQLRTVQEVGAELSLPIHLWPDTDLIDEFEGETHEWLCKWLFRRSPEPFATTCSLPTDSMPDPPEDSSTVQSGLLDF